MQTFGSYSQSVRFQLDYKKRYTMTENFLESGDLAPEKNPIRPLSTLLEDLKAGLPEGDVPLDTVLESLHERGFGVLLFFLAFPMALPVPKPPGVTFILGIPLLLLTAQQAIGRHTVWLPEKIQKRTIGRDRLACLIEKVIPWLLKLETFVRPRMGWATRGVFSRLSGLSGVVMSTAIFLPFPGFNTVPSMSLCLLAIGDVMRDGLAVLIGSILGVAWIFFLASLITFLGIEGVHLLKEEIMNFL